MRFALAALLCAAPAAAAPVALQLEAEANQTAQYASSATDYRLLTGAWTAEGGPSTRIEGARTDTAWRLRANQQATLAIFAPLRAQITAAGYSVLFECETEDCGGFDFRYALDLVQEPQMHIDLGDFRYLAARRGAEWLALTVSRSSESGFVNLTTISAGAAPSPAAAQRPAAQQAQAPAVASLGARLEADGSVALDDLAFASGAIAPENGDYGSLRALADYLATRPDARIVLVGHTDATGGLDANIAVSRKRAEAVRALLVASYGIRSGQLDAQGAGWLAPRASNLTPEGHERNRRVEAVLLTGP